MLTFNDRLFVHWALSLSLNSCCLLSKCWWERWVNQSKGLWDINKKTMDLKMLKTSSEWTPDSLWGCRYKRHLYKSRNTHCLHRILALTAWETQWLVALADSNLCVLMFDRRGEPFVYFWVTDFGTTIHLHQPPDRFPLTKLEQICIFLPPNPETLCL